MDRPDVPVAGSFRDHQRVKGAGMLGIISLLVIVVLSIVVNRVATIALMNTGMSKQAARFQSRSALTGVGFTTSESEEVVKMPGRRRILLALMLLGNAGIVTAISSLIVGFVGDEQGSGLLLKSSVLIAGLALLWVLTKSGYIEARMARLISKVLEKSEELRPIDYSSLLHLSGEYRIYEMRMDSDHWLCGRTLSEAGLSSEGVLVLGMTREDGTYIGSPQPGTEIRDGDDLVLYGREKSLEELKKRKEGAKGNTEHAESVREQDEEVRRETAEDERSRAKSELADRG